MYSDQPARILEMHPWLGWASLTAAVAAAAILVWYLVKRPPVYGPTKSLLLLGIGVLPIGVALTSNLASMQHMQQREFCGSCHVMLPFTRDAADPTSMTLAARHSRNASFGEQSCYTCHEDYGMFGTVVTKIGGLEHVWFYYTEYQFLTIDEALPRIQIYEPFPNSSCIQCHSTDVPVWNKVNEHAAALDDLRSGTISCASAPCHGPPHPVAGRERARADGGAE